MSDKNGESECRKIKLYDTCSSDNTSSKAAAQQSDSIEEFDTLCVMESTKEYCEQKAGSQCGLSDSKGRDQVSLVASNCHAPRTTYDRSILDTSQGHLPFQFKIEATPNTRFLSDACSSSRYFKHHSIATAMCESNTTTSLNSFIPTNITDGIEIELQMKNDQLWKHCLMLDKSKEEIAGLKTQMGKQQQDCNMLKQNMEEIRRLNRELNHDKQELNAMLADAQRRLSEGTSEIHQLHQKISHLVFSKEKIERESQSVISELESKNLDVKCTNEQLHHRLSTQQEELKHITEQQKKEEKARLCAEKEVKLATDQGQSLLDQQMAARAQHQEEIVTLKQELAKKNELCNKLESQLKAEQTRLDDAMERLENLKQTYDNNLAESKRQLNIRTDEGKIWQERFSELHEQNTSMNQTALDKESRLTAEKALLQNEIDSLKENHIQEMNRKLAEYNEQMKQERECQNKKFESDKQTTEKERVELKCQIAELEDKLEEKQLLNSSLKDQIQELRNAQQELIKDYHNITAQVSEDKKCNQKAFVKKDAKIEALNCELTQLKSLLEQQNDNQRTLELMQTQANKVNKDKAELTENLKRIQKAFEELMVEKTVIQQETECSKAKSTQLVRENSQLSKQVTDTENNLKSIQQAFEDLQNKQNTTDSKTQLFQLKISQLTNENSNLSTSLMEAMEKLRSTQQAYDEIKTLSEINRVTQTIRSRKDSGKAILMGQRESKERKSSALSLEKNDKIKSLQQRICLLEKENRSLRMQSDSIIGYQGSQTTSVQNSVVTMNREGSEDENIRLMLARKESSNQILTAENTKLKAQLRNAEEASNRDISDLQQQNRAQLFTIKQMESECATQSRAIKNLTEFNQHSDQFDFINNPMKTFASSSKQGTSNSCNASDIETDISRSDENVSKKVLMLKAIESDAKRVLASLMEPQKLLEENKTASELSSLKTLTEHIELLVKNIQITNSSVFSELQSSYMKQIYLHEKFKQTLDEMQANVVTANDKHHNEVVRMQTEYKDEVNQLKEIVERLAAENYREAHENETNNTFESENLDGVTTSLHCAHQKLERAEATGKDSEKSSLHSSKKLNQLQCDYLQLERKYKRSLQECTIAREQNFAALQAVLKKTIEDEKESHENTAEEYLRQLKIQQQIITTLLSEKKELHEKATKNLKPLITTIEQLDENIQKLSAEKLKLQQDYKAQLHEHTLTVDDLQSQLSKSESANKVINKECAEQKSSISNIHRQYSKELNMANSKLEANEICMRQQINDADNHKRQLTVALENYTKLEIEYFKIKHNSAHEAQQSKEALAMANASLEKMTAVVNEKGSQIYKLEEEIKRLKSIEITLQNERQLDRERLSIAKKDVEHAQSVSSLYKQQYESSVYNSKEGLPLEPLKSSTSSGSLGTKMAELTNKITILENENIDLNRKLVALSKNHEEKQKENLHLQSAMKLNSQKNNDYKYDVISLKKQLDQLQSEITKNMQDKQSLKAEIARCVNENETLKGQLSNRDMAIEKFNHKNLTNSTKLEELKEQLIHEQAKTVKTSTKLTALETVLHKLKQEQTREQQNALQAEEQLQNQVTSLNRKVAALQQDINNAYDANKSLRHYITRMKRSFGNIFGESNSNKSPNNE